MSRTLACLTLAIGLLAAPAGAGDGTGTVRTGTVRGRLVAPGEEAPPGLLRARFQPSERSEGSGTQKEGHRASGTVPCTVEDRLLTCRVPAGELDLRLEMSGFAPVYAWGLRVDPEQVVEMGNLAFAKGASVSGKVLDERTRAPVEGAAVELRPTGLTFDPAPEADARAKMRRLRKVTDARGFFQVAGVPRGAYELWVAKEGVAEGARGEVEVSEEREYPLGDPLLLGPPPSLEVLLTPPLDPYGEPWRVLLLRHMRASVYEPAKGLPSAAAPSGSWTAEGLATGRYVLTIGNALDPSWHLETIEVGPGHEVLEVELDFVAVEGTLSLAGEPLSCTLWFGGRHGDESVRFDADEDGEFRGFLPREGEWKVDLSRPGWRGAQRIEPVVVEKASGQEVARVDVELPNTTLRGRVVDGDGRPQPGAHVLAANLEKASVTLNEAADEEGKFEFRGLEPATLRIQAQSLAGTSDWVPVRLEDGQEGSEVTLRIVERRTVRGRVVSPSGPVADATVRLVPAFTGRGPVAVVNAVTAPNGRFEADVPGYVGDLNVLVLPPGYTARILPWHLPAVAAGGGAIPPLQIRVDTGGGTLHLGPEPGRAGQAPSGLLLHQGAMVGVESFSGWGELPAGAAAGNFAEPRIEIPSVQSGYYRLCSRSLLAPDATAGVRRCDEGFLPDGGELALTIPSKTEAEP